MRRFLRAFTDVRLHRALVAFAFFAPVGVGLWQALADTRTEFLSPSLRAEWALHPTQDILNFQRGRVSRDVEFSRLFRLSDRPERFIIRLRAFTFCRVFVNGTELSPARTQTNWKRSQEYDATALVHRGENALRVRVSNSGAIPALLVEAPAVVRTRGEWKAALEPAFSEWSDVVSPTRRAPQPGPLQEWRGWRAARWVVVAWLVGVVALIGFASARTLKSHRGEND